MFDKIVWEEERMVLNGLIYKLQHFKNEKWSKDDESFVFYKIKKLVDQYQTYFTNNKLDSNPKNIVEIGLWDGGSMAFWNEILNPKKLVGVDIMPDKGNAFLNKYLNKVNANQTIIKPYWETDQSDVNALRKIVETNFGNEPIDIVFDDGSHMYHQTLVSFNTIFPYLAAGGIYVIEDWAWSHWQEDNGLPVNTSPSKLVQELVQATANVGLIESLSIFEGFVVVKRGLEIIKDKENFSLANYIYNKPLPFKSKVKKALQIFGVVK